jgi:hypothetical protein
VRDLKPGIVLDAVIGGAMAGQFGVGGLLRA